MIGRGWGKPLRGEDPGLSRSKHTILLHSACYGTPGSRLEVRCRNTMSKHVPANAVEVEAKDVAARSAPQFRTRAGCPPQRRSEWWRPVGGDGPAACNPVDREGGANPGCISGERPLAVSAKDSSSRGR